MTTKLVKLNARRLHHMEIPQLIIRFISDYEASKIKSSDEDFKRLFNQLKSKLEHFVAMDAPINRHEDKRLLREADNTRDQDVKVLLATLRAFRLSKRTDEALAYRTLTTLVKHYREISSHNYEEESFAISHLLGKLKEEPYRTHVTTLNLTKFVANLTDSQAKFETLFNAIETKRSTQVKTSQINKVRDELYEEYQVICEYIESMARVKGTETYKKILALINKGREFYVVTIHRRTGKKIKQEIAEVSDTETLPIQENPTSAENHLAETEPSTTQSV